MITQARLKQLLHYDAETGIMYKITTGKPAGWNQSGYLKTTLDGKKYYLHRLAWLYSHGYFPLNEIDHINNVRNDNRLCNLREASRLENLANSPVKNHSRLGLKGIEYIKHINKYAARICHKGNREILGYFSSPFDAHKTYLKRSRELHGDFSI